MYFLGIDPGISGGVALLDEKEVKFARAFDPEEFMNIVAFLKAEPMATRCCLEKVASMHGQGVKSMFTFGRNFGWLEGVMDMGGITYYEIPPQTWKKEFGLSSDKQKSIKVCEELFPGVNLKRTPKCKNSHDGIAEALLMAEYARRRL